MCGLANSLETLILYRVGQGLCGALIMPMGQAIVLATFPRELHATVMVIWGFGSVVGPVVGPVLGSMIAETYNWRAVFFMIVPPGLMRDGVRLVVARRTTPQRTRARLDWTGFLALSVAMTGLQLMIDRGQRLDWFESPEIVLYAAVGGRRFLGLRGAQPDLANPFLDPRLLLNRNFAIGLMIAFFMGMLAFTSLMLFPTLLHDLRGYPDSTIGELLAARGIGNWVAFLVVVPISRRFPRLTVAFGLDCAILRRLADGAAGHQSDELRRVLDQRVAGLRLRPGVHADDRARFRDIAGRQITEASGVFTLVRNFGSSLFISVTVVMLVRSTQRELRAA